jgi:hypothetical protein
MGVVEGGGGMLRVWGEGQCIGQRFLVGRLKGKRPRGMHNFRRTDDIESNFKEIALECVDWINMIRDGLL